jgi:MFS transporter, UMF1 family
MELPSRNEEARVEASLSLPSPTIITSDSTTGCIHHNHHQRPHTLPRFYPHWRNGAPVFYGNREALGWALDAVGRAVTFIAAGAFLGTALLHLARVEVGCATEPEAGSNQLPECHARVYGLFRPSSFLTTYTVVVGLASAVFLPVMGAIVDYTPHRRRVGRVLSVTLCALVLPQLLLLSDTTWLAVAALQIGVAFCGWAQSMITHAYLPELSDKTEELAVFVQFFTICSLGAMVLFLIFVIALSTWFDLGDIDTARLGLGVAWTISVVTLYLAWAHLMQTRPALRPLPPNRSLWTAGFYQVWHSGRIIARDWKALKWFYVYVVLVDGAVGSLGTIMITYLTDRLLFTSTENGVAILLLLVGSVPGALVAGRLNRRWKNPVVGSLLATILLAANTIVAAVVLKEAHQQLETYVLAFIWGAGTGWKWTCDRLVISTILPVTGQDAELMGLYLFCGQAFTWIPPLVYTGMNEAGIDQRIGIGSVSLFFIFGAVSISSMGPYRDAVVLAGRVVAVGHGSSAEPSDSIGVEVLSPKHPELVRSEELP